MYVKQVVSLNTVNKETCKKKLLKKIKNIEPTYDLCLRLNFE